MKMQGAQISGKARVIGLEGTVKIELNINGEIYPLDVEPRWSLLKVLRDLVGLKGTKKGCDQASCGSCTVLLNGLPIYSCITLALDAMGKDIITIEGLSQGDKIDPIQESFARHGAAQCGFCTPGMILSAKALLNKAGRPDENEIAEALAGNLCRCTGYSSIIKATLETLHRLR